MIAHVEAGNPLYTEPSCRIVRATIMFARGDAGCFDAEIHRSLALADGATDPQAKGPVSIYAAFLRLWADDRAGAEQLLDSTLATARTSEVGIELIHYEAALLAALLGLDPVELAIPQVEVAETPKQRATAALLEGDLLAAADALADLGKVNDEAYLRLRAGERLLPKGPAGRASAGGARAHVLPQRPCDAVRSRGRGAPRRHPPAVGLAAQSIHGFSCVGERECVAEMTGLSVLGNAYARRPEGKGRERQGLPRNDSSETSSPESLGSVNGGANSPSLTMPTILVPARRPRVVARAPRANCRFDASCEEPKIVRQPASPRKAPAPEPSFDTLSGPSKLSVCIRGSPELGRDELSPRVPRNDDEPLGENVVHRLERHSDVVVGAALLPVAEVRVGGVEADHDILVPRVDPETSVRGVRRTFDLQREIALAVDRDLLGMLWQRGDDMPSNPLGVAVHRSG